MATSSSNQSTGLFGTLWQHKGSLAISFLVTVAALGIYYVTFLGERPSPLFDFIARFELNSLDTRFRIRGRVHPDPRIVIVDIDQRSEEILGKWPFPRSNFARMLDALNADGARVAAFDITFSELDRTSQIFRDAAANLEKQKKEGGPASPQLAAWIALQQQKYDYDDQFAAAIKRFGKVVLGNFFLYTQADLEGVSDATLERFANLIGFFPYPQVRAIDKNSGKEDFKHLIQEYEDANLLPKGAEANTEDYTGALSSERAGMGFFNVVPDADVVVRRALLALPYGRDPDRANWDFYASIDVQAIRLYLNLPADQTVLNFGPAGIVSLEFGPRLIVRPDPVGRLMINYQGPAHTYARVSIADVVSGHFPAGTFRDKIVLVGATATGIGDLRSTPFGGLYYPGVEIHANVIDNILNQKFLQHGAKQALADLGLILLFGIPLGLWLAVTQPRWLPFGLLLLVPFAWLEYTAFVHGWWLNFITPSLFTLVPNVGLVALYRVLVEEREKRRVRGAFQQYVSPEVIRRVLLNPELVQPRKTEISTMFSDIRGFTNISERLDAQELADLLNSYLTEMTGIIFRNRGMLDKYIGDAVMAIWGAPFKEPQHARRACTAALDMLDRLGELQIGWKARGWPLLEIGIGVNTGVASVGNMGSTLRYGYTAMGDSVNLASRIEGLNKEYGTRIIVSESTYAGAHGDGMLFRELDLIRVKGKDRPVTIFELLGRDGQAPERKELAEFFDRGREAYKRRDWREAQKRFAQLLERWPDDGPARVYLTRTEEYLIEEPAADWDGVYVMKHK